MKRALGVLILLASLCSPASAEIVENEVRIPVSRVVSPPCTESILFEGENHLLFAVSTTQNGQHFVFHLNFQQLKGIGLESGAVYQLHSTKNEVAHESFSGEQASYHLIRRLQLVGPGPANNYSTDFDVRIIVNANGEVTAFVDDIRIVCPVD